MRRSPPAGPRKRRSPTRSEPPPTPFALGLGGNLGPVEATLRWALARLAAALGPLTVASLYRSRAVSPIPQADYLNTAAVGRTALDPEAILSLAKALEQAAGRIPGPRFGPRPLDIDLLLYGETVSSAPELTLPHPRLAERRFVLEPLSEIAPDLTVPPDGERVADLAHRADDAVVKVGWSRQPTL